MSIFNNKNVLVTGAGLIGIPLVDLLLERAANVTVVSLDDKSRINKHAEFIKADLTEFSTCKKIVENKNYVFHLAGIKGNPKVSQSSPASFLVPMLQFNTNMAEASRLANVDWYLYTSSVGVYPESDSSYEDLTINSIPSKNDRFPGWGKLTGELQLESYKIQYGFNKYSIVRPTNIYGRFDNFSTDNGMVIPNIINRMLSLEDGKPFFSKSDGSTIRDFMFADDCANAMLYLVENKINDTINIGTGIATPIKMIIEIIRDEIQNLGLGKHDIIWGEKDNNSGDDIRVLECSRLLNYGFKNHTTDLRNGIRKTIEWYIQNKDIANNRYNIFEKS